MGRGHPRASAGARARQLGAAVQIKGCGLSSEQRKLGAQLALVYGQQVCGGRWCMMVVSIGGADVNIVQQSVIGHSSATHIWQHAWELGVQFCLTRLRLPPLLSAEANPAGQDCQEADAGAGAPGARGNGDGLALLSSGHLGQSKLFT